MAKLKVLVVKINASDRTGSGYLFRTDKPHKAKLSLLLLKLIDALGEGGMVGISTMQMEEEEYEKVLIENNATCTSKIESEG